MFFSSGQFQFQTKNERMIFLKKTTTVKRFGKNKFVFIRILKKERDSLSFKVRLKGQHIEFDATQMNFAEYFDNPALTTSLVNIPKIGVDSFIFDSRADSSYMTYAGLQECICCGSHKNLAPKVSDSFDRCGAIDQMIIDEMPIEYRKTYILKRIEMFETLIDRKFYGDDVERKFQFEHALKIMKKELEKLLD